MISFIIPAYNESLQIAEVVESVSAAANDIGVEHEILVIDDASDDNTAQLAAEAGATVIAVQKRQISAVRNAGAAAAAGDVLVFVDGDTFLNPITLTAALKALENGAIGGGALIRFDHARWTARLAIGVAARGLRLFGLCGGCFMFVQRDAFEAVDGFDEDFYASEEIWLAKALHGTGRFVVLSEKIVTSGRKARQASTLSLFWLALWLGLKGPKQLRRREGLEIWYSGNRQE